MRRIICALVISLACLLSATNARSNELASCPVGTIASVLGTTCRIGFAQFSFYQFNTWFYDYSGNWTSGPAASDIAFIPDGSNQNAPEITLVFNVSVTDHEYATAALYFLASTLSAPRYFSGIDIIDSELQVGPGIYGEANTFGSVSYTGAIWDCYVGADYEWNNGALVDMGAPTSCSTTGFPTSMAVGMSASVYSFWAPASVTSSTFVFDIDKHVPVAGPASILLLASGLGGLFARRWYRV